MKTSRRTGLLGASLLLALGSSCARTQKHYRVTSHPPGATVYIDGEKRGQTDDGFNVNFRSSKFVTIRMEKEGYLPEGGLLRIEDEVDEYFVVLKEAPHSVEIRDTLKGIQGSLDALPARLSEQMKEREKAK